MPGFNVLIPLDGTSFAESSLLLLPMLKSLGFQHARLLSVWDRQQKRQSGVARDSKELESYLKQKVEAITGLGYEVELTVREGKAAETTVAAASEADVDLILLATHGRTGIARLRLGSVGDRIIKESPAPRLVVGPNIEIDLASFSLRRLLLPLDGSQLGEAALPIAKYIAGVSGAEIELLRCVSVIASGGPEAMAAGVDILAASMEQAESYLARVSGSLSGSKVKSTVLVGGPADGIVNHIREKPC